MLVNLRALLVRLIDIILLRGGPEQLPASSGLLAVVVALSVAVSALISAILAKAPINWEAQLLLQTAVIFVWFKVAFTLAKKPERFLQTATAVFGVITLFAPAYIPIHAELQPFLLNPDPKVPPPMGLMLLGLLTELWLITVLARIVRAAFEWPVLGSVVFLLGMIFASALAYGMLFGVPPNSV
jgi:hypothetical protein